jgi:2,3-bisphosphoglycerate-dependent phosphoglycerate mutase
VTEEIRQLKFAAPPGACRLLLLRHGETTPVRRLGLEPVVEPRLIEIDLGDRDGGECRRRVAAKDPIALRVTAEQRWDVIPGAERMERFAARVRDGIEAVAAAHPVQTVVVSHGGTIGQALAEASGSRPLAFAPDNGSISEIVVSGHEWALRRFNDVGHLDGR